MRDDSSHILYRMFDTAGQLLYVGMTANPAHRIRDHKTQQSWWSDVAEIKVEHFLTRADLAAAEREAIRTENPRFNSVRYTDPTSPRPRKPPPTIGLAAVRKARGLTVENVADELGISQNLVTAIEAGTIPLSARLKSQLELVYRLKPGSILTEAAS